jgi:hypothetical protein
MLNLNLNLIRTVVGISEGAVCPAELISTTSIMAYYKFDGDYTKTLGEAFFGTISPVDTTLSAGKFDQAVSFNGTSSYLPFGNNNLMEPSGTAGWSLSTWFYTNSTANQSIWDKRVPGSSGMRVLVRPTLDILVTWNTQNQGFSLPSALSTGQWYHICVRQLTGTNTFEVLVDNVSLGTSTRSAYTASGQNLNVGRDRANSSSYLNGRLDEYQVWDRQLTNDEVAALAAGTCPLTTP